MLSQDDLEKYCVEFKEPGSKNKELNEVIMFALKREYGMRILESFISAGKVALDPEDIADATEIAFKGAEAVLFNCEYEDTWDPKVSSELQEKLDARRLADGKKEGKVKALEV